MLAKPLMFLSAYAPLFAILAVRFDTAWLRQVMVWMAIVGAGSLVLIFYVNKKTEAGPRTIAEIHEAGAEAASFLAAYLLPFVTVSRPSVQDLVGYGIFLGVAYAIHLRTSVVQVNPLLYVFGQRVYWTVDTVGKGMYVISNKQIRRGEIVQGSALSDDVTVARRVASA